LDDTSGVPTGPDADDPGDSAVLKTAMFSCFYLGAELRKQT
jgi:hypothetical protein